MKVLLQIFIGVGPPRQIGGARLVHAQSPVDLMHSVTGTQLSLCFTGPGMDSGSKCNKAGLNLPLAAQDARPSSA